MMTSVCGIDCGACENYGCACKGCAMQEGEVFWTHLLGEKTCAIYQCARRKQLSDCGACDEMPCSLYRRLHDPAITEDEQLCNICAQMGRLRQAQ